MRLPGGRKIPSDENLEIIRKTLADEGPITIGTSLVQGLSPAADCARRRCRAPGCFLYRNALDEPIPGGDPF